VVIGGAVMNTKGLIEYIAKALGHSSINVTMDIHGHLMDTVNQKAASRLGRTVLGKEEDVQSEDGSKMVAEAGV
jgi:integrase